MIPEKIIVKLLVDGKESIFSEIKVYERDPNEDRKVLLELNFNGRVISKSNYDFFTTLQDLRTYLESQNCQIICNGAAKNVYPSPMQLSMTRGRLAYITHMGYQAQKNDIINIFDCSANLDFVCVDEQNKYHANWIKSL